MKSMTIQANKHTEDMKVVKGVGYVLCTPCCPLNDGVA